MTSRLPLFPLNAVLYPGVLLPLRVFEYRYRRLVEDLMAQPQDVPRRFGVIALRGGHEVAPTGPALPEGPTAGFSSDDPLRSLYQVGCIAEVASVQKLEEGALETPDEAGDGEEDEDTVPGFKLVATGTTRFSLSSVDATGDYLVGEVEELPEVTGPGAAAAVPAVTAAFREYQRRLAAARERSVTSGQELPEDPQVLSYLVAAASVLETHRKQQLLAARSTAVRLEAELRMLRHEAAVIGELPSLPAADLPHRMIHLN